MKIITILLTGFIIFNIFMIVKSAYGYDISELQTITSYCFLHADRPNPIQDLVNQGLVNSTYSGWSCGQVKKQLQIEEKRIQTEKEAEAQKKLEFTSFCINADNMTKEQFNDCVNAGYYVRPDTFQKLFGRHNDDKSNK
jgi:hypothetical protein